MNRTFALVATITLPVTVCYAQNFLSATVAHHGAELVLKRGDDRLYAAPKFEDQDEFSKPAIAPGGRSAGWLALYPDRGASYSQPLSLVVLDQSNRVHRFRGDFGMVYGWCYADLGTAVTVMYSFPHGTTPIGYDKRRIRDGKLLARKQIEPIKDGPHYVEVLQSSTPEWAQCALSNSRIE